MSTLVQSPTDSELMLRARIGDQDAFGILIERWQLRLRNFISQMSLRDDECDDCVQEAFIKAWNARERFNKKYAFSTWLFTIARRRALNILRDRKRHTHLDAVAEATDQSANTADDNELPEIWQEAKQLLSEKYYQLLWLHYSEDLGPNDLAEVLGISSVNARVSLHRARAKLEQHLRQQSRWQPYVQELSS